MGMNVPGGRFGSSGVITALLFLMLFIVSVIDAGWACTTSWFADGPLFQPALVYLWMCLALMIVQWVGMQRIWFPIVGLLMFIAIFVVFVSNEEIRPGLVFLIGVVLLGLLNVAAILVHDSPVVKWTSGIASLGSFGVLLVFLISAPTLIPGIYVDIDHCRRSMQDISGSIKSYSKDHDGKYPETLRELVPRYRKSFPRCIPGDYDQKTRDYFKKKHMMHIGEYKYEVNSDKTQYTISCGGMNHRACGSPIEINYIGNTKEPDGFFYPDF